MAKIRVKPAKAQSMLGFVVGVVFIFIGISFISSGGWFGVFWTLMAVLITIFNGMNAFSEKGVATHVINAEIEGISEKKYDFADKLRELESLREDGIITYEEYEKKRKDILDKNW